MSVLKLHHGQVSIPKGAEVEARNFYCGFIGLTEIQKPESLRDRGGFWIQLGEIQIHFGTEDGVDRLPNEERFEFRDPFGNRVEFLQRMNSLP